jgi:hypothetical protein
MVSGEVETKTHFGIETEEIYYCMLVDFYANSVTLFPNLFSSFLALLPTFNSQNWEKGLVATGGLKEANHR